MDLSPDAIAAQLGATEADGRLALATIRTRNPRRSRGTINATLEAGEFVEREGRNGEPQWATLDRRLDELARLRAIATGHALETSGMWGRVPLPQRATFQAAIAGSGLQRIRSGGTGGGIPKPKPP